MGKLLKTKGYPRSVIRNLLFTRMSIQRGGVPIDIQPFNNSRGEASLVLEVRKV